MLDPTDFNEFYVVEKAIEVVARIGGEDRRIRIEALYHGPNSSARYSTTSYMEEDVTIQPTYLEGPDGFERKPESVRIWIAYDLPWTDRDSADAALNQALGFLRERVS